DLAWSPDRARALGDAMVALWGELLERLPELPVNRPFAAGDVAAAVALPVPEEPLEEEALLAHVRELVFEQSLYAGHPGFMAYIVGSGTVPGAAADLLAAGLNPNTGGWVLSPAASELELHLMRLFARRFGLPDGAGGLMTTGGATSNFTALKAARDSGAPGSVRRDGLGGARMTMYASTEAHATNVEAADLMGIGESAVRAIPTD